MRKELEPLWRFLRLHNDADPFNAMIHGITELAEEGLVSSDNGRVSIRSASRGDASANTHLMASLPQPSCMHTMLNTLGGKLLVSVSIVTPFASRTAAAFVVDGNAVSVEYMDPQAFIRNLWHDKTVYNATETATQDEAGALHYGFIRAESTPRIDRGRGTFALRIKLLGTTASPIYIAIPNMWTMTQRAVIGKNAKNIFEQMGD